MRQWTSTALATWETTSTVSIGAPSQNHSDGGPGGTRSHAMKQLSAMRTVSGLRSSTQPRPGRTMPRSCRLANLASDVSRFPLANAACTPNGGFSRTVPSTSSIRVSGGSGISKNASAVISCCFTLIVALLCLHLVCMIRHSSLAASTTFRRPANQSLNMLMGESGFGIDRHEERWNRACLRPCPRIGCQYLVDPGQRSMACSTIDGRHLQHRVELASRQLHRPMEVRQDEDIGKQGALLNVMCPICWRDHLDSDGRWSFSETIQVGSPVPRKKRHIGYAHRIGIPLEHIAEVVTNNESEIVLANMVLESVIHQSGNQPMPKFDRRHLNDLPIDQLPALARHLGHFIQLFGCDQLLLDAHRCAPLPPRCMHHTA